MSEGGGDWKPPFPPGMTRNYFGNRVMQWGTGYEAATARIETITLAWLVDYGVTLEMARAWRGFYEETYEANPENLSAKGRIELMSHCERLFEERGSDGDADNAD